MIQSQQRARQAQFLSEEIGDPTPSPTKSPIILATDAPSLLPSSYQSMSVTGKASETPSLLPFSYQSMSVTEKASETQSNVHLEAPTAPSSLSELDNTSRADSDTSFVVNETETIGSFNNTSSALLDTMNATNNRPSKSTPVNTTQADKNQLLLAQVQSIAGDKEVFLEFSLFTSNVSDAPDFITQELQVLRSLELLLCQTSNEKVEGTCLLRRDLFKVQDYPFIGERQGGNNDDGDDNRNGPSLLDATLLDLMIPSVSDHSSDSIKGLSWSAWRIPWKVLRLGSTLARHIIQDDVDHHYQLSPKNVYQRGVETIQVILNMEMEANIRNGTFDALLYDIAGGADVIVSSILGEEDRTFESMVVHPDGTSLNSDQNDQQVGHSNNKAVDGLTLYLIIFGCLAGFLFIGLMITCFTRQSSRSNSNSSSKEQYSPPEKVKDSDNNSSTKRDDSASSPEDIDFSEGTNVDEKMEEGRYNMMNGEQGSVDVNEDTSISGGFCRFPEEAASTVHRNWELRQISRSGSFQDGSVYGDSVLTVSAVSRLTDDDIWSIYSWEDGTLESGPNIGNSAEA